MAINLEDKKVIVAEVNEAAKAALSAVVVNARGVTVGAMIKLRKEAREAGVYIRVVRNTLLKRAVAETEYSILNDVFTGPTMIAFSKEYPGAAARLFKEFAKSQNKLEIKAAAFEGKFLTVDQVDILATFTTRNEAISQLMSVIQGATSKLAYTLALVFKQKESAASLG
ncbi:50S ribosomal protein L10 [Candidatus Pseudomonas adelgestsugas]|uniref:Large ribosomal subunit protein uL10 n=1 Tax=Candidatus Pseudomonas adelgestsugas TaxID=1302376 RepID=A0ABX5R7T4_9PSED|nr:50S ribosomal protein L10 [Candidatus Pseudomonas adelgestsugas]QAX81623.1 50S ribosomal protein L10 [Candidatus Pseudomonas adelgestsugas]